MAERLGHCLVVNLVHGWALRLVDSKAVKSVAKLAMKLVVMRVDQRADQRAGMMA